MRIPNRNGKISVSSCLGQVIYIEPEQGWTFFFCLSRFLCLLCHFKCDSWILWNPKHVHHRIFFFSFFCDFYVKYMIQQWQKLIADSGQKCIALLSRITKWQFDDCKDEFVFSMQRRTHQLANLFHWNNVLQAIDELSIGEWTFNEWNEQSKNE